MRERKEKEIDGEKERETEKEGKRNIEMKGDTKEEKSGIVVIDLFLSQIKDKSHMVILLFYCKPFHFYF